MSKRNGHQAAQEQQARAFSEQAAAVQAAQSLALNSPSVGPRLTGDALAEVRALSRQAADALQALGQADMAVAIAEQQRAQARLVASQKAQAAREAGEKHMAGLGLDPADRWGLNLDTGELVKQ